MKNFRVAGGDLVLNSARRVDTVTGEQKLLQDLTLWLLEPVGTGFIDPSFGSKLDTFIGLTADMADSVTEEIQRVLNRYQNNQAERIKNAQRNGQIYLFTRREVLWEITSVLSSTDKDRVAVTAKIKTASGKDLTIDTSVDTEGASVA